MNIKEHYFHMFANGEDAKNFIISNDDFKAAMARYGICAHCIQGVRVLAFSIEETHPHALLYGLEESCAGFRDLFDLLTRNYIINSRGHLDGVTFHSDIYCIDSDEYLLNVASYVLVQPTKDGKSVMPYNYLWGTGNLYFRKASMPLIWEYDQNGNYVETTLLSDYSLRQRRKLLHSKYDLPLNWKVCNGILLPSNFVDIEMYENIFRTHNRFRVFMASNKQITNSVLNKMLEIKGVLFDDLEAQALCGKMCMEMFGKKTARMLSIDERIALARALRKQYKISLRQLSTLTRIPKGELRTYL